MRLSRLREHFADAYSAYLTGNPQKPPKCLSKNHLRLISCAKSYPEGARASTSKTQAKQNRKSQKSWIKKTNTTLDHDGVLDERELELAMEKESKSTWVQMNSLFATHPPTFKRILLLKEIEQEMDTGKYSNDKMYTHV